jgi:hypothetical protein
MDEVVKTEARMSETRYRVSHWYNPDEDRAFFGVQLRNPFTKKWLNAARNGEALFFDKEADAKREIEVLKQSARNWPTPLGPHDGTGRA